MTNDTGIAAQSLINRAVSSAGPAFRVSTSISRSLQHASAKAGVSFEYLLNTAKRESSLNPNAKAKTSSAEGLFQFIDQTWLAAVHKHGKSHGLAREADKIQRTSNGHFTVTNPNEREKILELRLNPEKASALAAELAADNRQILETRLNRSVNDAELYAAHFLGVGGAAKLLSAPQNTKAAELLPAAAKANKGVFYTLNGAKMVGSKTVGDVIASFEKTFLGGVDPQNEKPFKDPIIDGAIIAEPTNDKTIFTNISPYKPETIDLANLSLGKNRTARFKTTDPIPKGAIARQQEKQIHPRLSDGSKSLTERSNDLLDGSSFHQLSLNGLSYLSSLQGFTSNNLISKNLSGQNLTPIAISILQSLDPTLLGRRTKG